MRCLTFAIAVFVMAAELAAQETVLIAKGSTWAYNDSGADLGTAWRELGYNDSSWSSGAAQLGYGDDDEATTVTNNGQVTTYFRHTFTLSDPSQWISMFLDLTYDDGAVVYLNGTEVSRLELPATHNYLTQAIRGRYDNRDHQEVTIDPNLLRTGENVVAVEIHDYVNAQNDISFDLLLSVNDSVELVRGPYLQQPTDSSIIVHWRTSVATDAVVRYGTSPSALTKIATAGQNIDHAVSLTGLNPETTYYYSIGTSKETLAGDATYYFTTSPTIGSEKSFRIWAIGDSGTASNSAKKVYDAFLALEQQESQTADLWLMLGDNAYGKGTDKEYQAAVFDMYPEILRRTPLFSCIGNHDSNSDGYLKIFNFPTQAEIGGVASGSERYYSFDYANVHFVILDSHSTDRSVDNLDTTNIDEGGVMYKWLKEDLQSTMQPWIIALWHHPPYSKGSHDSDTEPAMVEMRAFLPLFEQYGVDFVLGGHSHSYERSYFIDGHYKLSETYSHTTHRKQAGDGNPDGDGPYTKSSYSTVGNEGAVYVVAGSSGKVSGHAGRAPSHDLFRSRIGLPGLGRVSQSNQGAIPKGDRRRRRCLPNYEAAFCR